MVMIWWTCFYRLLLSTRLSTPPPPPPPTKKTMKNTWLPSSKSSEKWIIVDPEAVLSTGYCQLEPNFCMQISKNAGQSQENFSSSSDKLRLSYRVALNLVAKKMIVFVFGSCLQTSQSPRGLVLAILVGVCRRVLQILTLFQTEKSFFHTSFQTRSPKSIPLFRPGIGRN